MIARLVVRLSPERRKAVYSLVLLLGSVLTVVGIGTDALYASWAMVVQAGLTVVALVVGAIAARRADMTALYAAAAALVVAMTGAGVWTDAIGDRVTQVLGLVVQMVPLILLVIRTDSSTATGEPVAEVAARHAVEEEAA